MAEYNKQFDMSLPANQLESLNAEKQNLVNKQNEAVNNTADPDRYTKSQMYASSISDIDRKIRSLTISNEVRPYPGSVTAPGPQQTQDLSSMFQSSSMPDAEKIRQQEIERQNLASQLSSLNTLYDEQLNQQRQKFAGLSGQQRAIAARGGILSTPRDEAQQLELAGQQQRVESVINAERTQATNNLIAKVNERADEKFKAERDFAVSERDKYLSVLKEKQAQARQDVAAFAQGGGSLTDLTTEEYQKLLKDTGMDDFALKASVNLNNPKSKAQFTAVGDKLVGYYINPKTGQFETFESQQIPGLSGGKYTMKETANGLLAIPENIDPNKSLDEQIKVYGAGTDYTKTGSQTAALQEYEYYKKQEEAAGRTPKSFDEYQTADANRKERAARAGDILTTKDIITGQTNLRKEFNALPVVKDFNDVKASYNRVNTAYNEAIAKGTDQKSKAAADQVLIVAFNKLIDPGSTVREGEYARSTEGQSVIARLKGRADAFINGGSGLTDEDRKNIVDATKKLYGDYEKMYNDLVTEYRGYAEDYGADPDKIAKQNSGSQNNINIDQIDWANVVPQ